MECKFWSGGKALSETIDQILSHLSWRDIRPSWSYSTGWGLYLKPRDMAKIGYLYLHNGVWEGKQLLPPEWVNKVSHPTLSLLDR